MQAPHSRIYNVGEELVDNTQLWRYMRLSALLMLLDGTVFIPTIETLRKEDPTEATALCQRTKTRFRELTEQDRECLLGCATSEESIFIKSNPDIDLSTKFSSIWGREIGKRRCAWCWHAGDIESMAQWHVYAKDGVAIRSTPKLIRTALGEHVVDSGVIGAVQYRDDDQDIDESAFLRPYLIKSRCYHHEKEVRVIVPREPTGDAAGLKVQIDGRKLISAIRISPLLPLDEAIGLKASLHGIVNRDKGDEFDQMQQISVQISAAKRVRDSMLDNCNYFSPQETSIANFGKMDMPFILSDDILRGLPGEQREPAGYPA